MVSTSQIQHLLDNNGTIYDNDGDKVGKIEQVYLDDQNSEPEWATVKTGMFGNAVSFVPLRDARVDGSNLTVPFDKDTIKDAPRIEDEDGHLSQDEESTLFRHYGQDYSTGSDGVRDGDDHDTRTGVESGTVGGDRDGAARGTGHDSQSMTRSEEQVAVGTEKVSGGKARLRKYVVTENVTKTVPVTHEEVRLEREPISEADRGDVTGSEIGEDVAEVDLSAEQVVVDKKTVPVEKVSMGTETVTEEQRVSEEVRKEQIDTGEADSRGTTDRGTTDRGTTDRGTTDRGTTDRGTTDRGTTDRGTTDRGTTDRDTTDRDTTDRDTTDRDTTSDR